MTDKQIEKLRLVALIVAESAIANEETSRGGWKLDHEYEIRRLDCAIDQLEDTP